MDQNNFTFRCLAYREPNGLYTGVCLDLDIIEEEHATLEEAILSINDAIVSHMEAAAQDGFPAESLYRPAPRKYWNKLAGLVIQNKKPKPAPLQFYNYQPYFLPSKEVYAYA